MEPTPSSEPDDRETPTVRELLDDVASAVNLQEGPEGVAQVLRVVGSSGRLPLRDVARAAHLPVPVLAAARRELEARGVLLRDGGLTLSPLGATLLDELGGPWSSPACPECSGGGVVVSERYHPVLHALERLWEGRPEVDVRLDQSYALPASNLRRCLYALDRGALLGKRVLFLGDDDAGSIAVALLARELGSRARVTALDIDTRVLEYLHASAEAEGLDVRLVEHDARQPLPPELLGEYDTVFTDPPYTLPALELFLSRALQAVGEEGGKHVFLSFGRRPPADAIRVGRALAHMGLAVAEVRSGFNTYEGASVLAGTSDLYHLVSAQGARGSVPGRLEGGIYTGELRPTKRVYTCLSCDTPYKVGIGRVWPTIEALKRAGCPKCGKHRFEQRQRYLRDER